MNSYLAEFQHEKKVRILSWCCMTMMATATIRRRYLSDLQAIPALTLAERGIHANLLRCAQKPEWLKVPSESFPSGLGYKGNNEVTNIASGQMSNFGTNALPPLFPPKKRMQLVFFSTSRKSDTQHEVDHRGETNLA
jgi:hypothetical protein